MAAASVDTAYLAGFYGLPQPNVQALIATPTTELVTSFLQTLITKAQEFEEAKSEQRRLEVELENAVHSGESRARALKTNADKALAEVESLRKKLNEEENARQGVQDELRSLQSLSTTSSSEAESLRAKVIHLETSNRETLALLDAKSTAHDKLAEELSEQQSHMFSSRREVSSLQERLQTVESEFNSAKFRAVSSQKEIEALKKNTEWLNTELQTKSSDHTKFRTEKNARITELQRAKDDAEANLASARRTETSLRQRMDELSQKLENSFTRIQQLEENATQSGESFRAELGAVRRLAELQEQSAVTSKRHVQELQEQAELTRMHAMEELSQTQAELETERQSKDAAETRVEELESRIERLEMATTEQSRAAFSRPATPNTRPRAFQTPLRGASPMPSGIGSAQSRGGLTVTQLYSELNQMRMERDEERRKNSKLNENVREVMEAMEVRAPELEEATRERGELQSQLEDATAALAKIRQERDTNRSDCKKAEGKVVGLQRQEQLLRQQVRDREAQVKFLTVMVGLYEDGQQVNQLQRDQLERLAMADFSDEAFSGMSDTDRFISQRLVTFRGISDLNATNARLLDLTRKLGEEMEGEEAKAKQHYHQELETKAQKLEQANAQLGVQLETLVAQSNSFVQERDMFRRMLENTKRMPANANLEGILGESVNSAATPRTPHIGTGPANGEQSPAPREFAEQMNLVKEFQAHLDNYKREAATDRTTLRSQIDALAREKSELQSEMARVKSQIVLAQERYDMLQANYNLSRTENDELQKRARSLEETNAKQEIRGQQYAEDLVQAQEFADGLRTESANLKAEKELWKRIETRLNEDNQALSEERARLNKMVSDTQSLSNQRETVDSETRRGLQAQIETLDSDLRATKRQLYDETNEARQASKRRELEQEQSRARQDDLAKSLSNTKEELIAAKTTRDQLQARVEELKIELRNAHERAEVLQPRPTARPATASASAEQSSLDTEQELLVQVSDLKRDLDLTRSELENVNAQVEQYKAIAQSSEEALNSLQEAQTQYSDDMDKIVAEKDASISQLEQRIQDISTESSETTKQLNDLRASSNEFDSRLEQQKSAYEDEIIRVKDDCERYKEAARFHQEDLKAQAQIAQRAQQSYESELVKHAEAAKALTTLREEFSIVRLEVSTAKASADAARAAMSQSEDSWSTSRDNYERELNDVKRGRDELSNQNKLLHQQLESVSLQITELQQKRVASSEGDDVDLSTDSGLQNLQEVIKYLRREKEIVDVQYELSTQEASRLKQHLSYAQSQLDDARLKLDQERQRQTDQERTSQSHSKMVETLNEINVYRESNASLRAESTRLRAQLEAQSKRAQDLQVQLEPLQASLRELENNLETAQGENKLLQEDRDRWQKRTQDILQKYDRVDPAELEELKSKLSSAEKEREEATAERTSLLENVNAQVSNARKETREKIQDQFKERSKQLSARVRSAEDEAKAARDELTTAKAELEVVRKERDVAIARPSNPQDVDTDMRDQTSGENHEEGEIAAPDDFKRKAQDALDRATLLQARITELESQLGLLQNRTHELQQKLDSNETELAKFRSASAQQIQESGDSTSGVPSEDHIKKLRADLEVAQSELQVLRSTSSTETPSTATSGQDLEAKLAAASADFEAKYDQRVEDMKKQLNEKLRAARVQNENEKAQLQAKLDEIQASHGTEMEKLKREHEQILSDLNSARHAIKTETLTDDSTPPMSSEAEQQYWTDVSKWTNDEVKKFMGANEHLRRLVSRNVTARSQKVEEELKQTHMQEVDELKGKIEKTREMAIDMESKKWKLKINMAENKLRVAVAKIEIISKAAADTPEKTVAEIWAVAKDFKPPTGSTASTTHAAAAGSVVNQQSLPKTAQAPQDPQTPVAEPATAALGPKTQQSPPSAAPQQQKEQSMGQRRTSEAPITSNIPQPGRRPSQSNERPLAQPPSRPPSRQGQQNGNGPPTHKATQAQPTGIPQLGRGGTSARGSVERVRSGQATAKLPDGPLGQNSNASRGGGSAVPRGGQRGNRTSSGQLGGPSGIARGGGSVGRGAFNPQAGQFTPQTQGAKRPREDGDGPGVGRAGKVPRGGGHA